METEHDITLLLTRAADGEPTAVDELYRRVFGELEQVATARLRARYGRDLAGATLEPAALVNETILHLIARPRRFENRRHFYAFTSKAMLHVLLNYERDKRAAKRGGDQVRLTLSALEREGEQPATSLVALAELLDQLEALDPRKAEVVRLRVLWGLENKEIAPLLGVSLATVERDWRFARTWLLAHLRS